MPKRNKVSEARGKFTPELIPTRNIILRNRKKVLPENSFLGKSPFQKISMLEKFSPGKFPPGKVLPPLENFLSWKLPLREIAHLEYYTLILAKRLRVSP